jgi:uncharacterized protein involved in exopolysaccharide biosynthesis
MQNKEEYKDERNLIDYINVLKRLKKLIISIVAVSVVAAGIISFLSPKIYEAKAVIMPSDQPNEQRGMNAIATQFGISAPSSSNTSEVISLLKSNILMERVIKRHKLLTVFFKKKELKGIPDASKIWNGIRYLKDIYKVRHNQREDVIELSAEFKDPKTAAEILQYILTELTDYMSSEAKRVADTNKSYLESLIDKNADPLIQQKIYSLIARQIETSMMAEVKENFAFKILDPPKAPDKKIKPKIRKNIITSFIISLFAGIFISFFIEYIDNIKKREKRMK